MVITRCIHAVAPAVVERLAGDGKRIAGEVEADVLTGPWKLVTYLENFGEQAYFVNFPSKFVRADGRTAWLCYSGNFATDWNNEKIQVNPPGTRYGLVLQEVRLLGPAAAPGR